VVNVSGKLKSWKGFSGPNFGLEPKWALHAVRFDRYVGLIVYSGSGQEMDDANQELETRTESIYD
jgi:hypothetical protein